MDRNLNSLTPSKDHVVYIPATRFARVQTLEDDSELEEAWHEAEQMDIEIYDFEQEMATSDGEDDTDTVTYRLSYKYPLTSSDTLDSDHNFDSVLQFFIVAPRFFRDDYRRHRRFRKYHRGETQRAHRDIVIQRPSVQDHFHLFSLSTSVQHVQAVLLFSLVTG